MERWKSRIFSLRTRMLAFVRQVLAFATGEVLETNWRMLEGKLAKVQTVDQLLRDHVDFLDSCLKQCMLTTSKLLGVSRSARIRMQLLTRLAGLRQIDDHHVGVCLVPGVLQYSAGQVQCRSSH
jgi:hypothetical protein